MDVRYWQAQYMQQPTSEEGALIKREWWQVWEREDPPPCEHLIMSLDAAQEKTNRSDFNALTTWGAIRLRILYGIMEKSPTVLCGSI